MMRVLVVVILFLSTVVQAQRAGSKPSLQSPDRNSLAYYLTLYSQSNGTLAPSFEGLIEFVTKLEKKRSAFRSEKAFLQHVFIKTHQRFLGRYEPYASFDALIREGRYNCLTATALYSVLLHHFTIDHKIIETNYHIFLMVNTIQGTVLLESTDFENGFVDNTVLIKKRLETYKKNTAEPDPAAGHHYEYSFSLLDPVSPTGLLGLLHYNHAIKAYNEQDYAVAIAHLHHAFLLHRSERMEEFARVMLVTITHSKLHDAQKAQYTQKIQAIQNKKYRTG